MRLVNYLLDTLATDPEPGWTQYERNVLIRAVKELLKETRPEPLSEETPTKDLFLGYVADIVGNSIILDPPYPLTLIALPKPFKIYITTNGSRIRRSSLKPLMAELSSNPKFTSLYTSDYDWATLVPTIMKGDRVWMSY